MTRAVRLTLLVLIAGCTTRPPADVAPPPASRTVTTCVISGERLAAVQVQVQVDVTGDTTFQDRPFRDAFSVTAEYAQDAEWQVHNEPLPEDVLPRDSARGDYVKYGRPVAAAAESLLWVADYHGVGVYAENENGRPNDEVLYVPVRPGCWFQRYQFSGVGEVRG